MASSQVPLIQKQEDYKTKSISNLSDYVRHLYFLVVLKFRRQYYHVNKTNSEILKAVHDSQL